MAPADVIKKYGADILRLWVASENYQDEIRISDTILDMLAKAYFNIRNACRYILGNIRDFDPKIDQLPVEEMLDIDRLTLHRLQDLVQRVRRSYDSYEFYGIYHALNNFTVDLSAFYHDVLKDRLYASPDKSALRRSAQTTMFKVITTLVPLMAPILAFTSEEVWSFIPEFEGKVESVHLADLPSVDESLVNQPLADRWERLLAVRSAVTKTLETARKEKTIGHPLDAKVTLYAEKDLFGFLKEYETSLREIFIVSQVELKEGAPPEDRDLKTTDLEGLLVSVAPSGSPKCPRCWIRDPQVPVDDQGEPIGVCPRCCQNALKDMGLA